METKPTLDTKQSLTETSAMESNGKTTLEFNRKADTGDAEQDTPLKVSLVYIQIKDFKRPIASGYKNSKLKRSLNQPSSVFKSLFDFEPAQITLGIQYYMTNNSVYAIIIKNHPMQNARRELLNLIRYLYF
jgi:hypothetical protein